jgi:uncharacterized damage-inducible protein DinB
MTQTEEVRVIEAPPGFASEAIALFVAQMDDQSHRLTEHTRGATVDELSWQPAPGLNTIGMLLAHIAVVEVYWMSILTRTPNDCPRVLGIGFDDDGIPMPEGGAPPAVLAGKDLAFFDDLLRKARANTMALASPLGDATLTEMIEQVGRVRRRQVSGRWILYHILEHEAGHYGQINLLRHQYRVR